MRRPLNIMIVDDHHGFRDLLRELLGSCAEVLCHGEPTFIECASGEDALSQAPAAAPDLVTMDLRLPGMDGMECIRKLRSMLPRAAMIVVTHLKDRSLSRLSLNAGADAVLLKDDLGSFLLQVRDCLALGRGS